MNRNENNMRKKRTVQGDADAKRAAAAENKALYEKGLILLEGNGVPRDVHEAVRCFCTAANAGNVVSIIKVIDLDETGDAGIRSAIMRYADDTLKKRLAYFRKLRNEPNGKKD